MSNPSDKTLISEKFSNLKSIKLLSSNENLIEREYSCNKIICKELDHPAKSWSRFRKVVPDNLEKQDPRRSTVTLTKQGDKVVLE